MRWPFTFSHTTLMVEIKNVTKVYQQNLKPVEALKGISLSLDKGRFISLMGPSGCGKSTLINLLGGLDFPTSGEILIDQKSTGHFTDDDWTFLRRKKIGIVFQFFHLLPTLTAVENVSLPLSLQGLSHSEVQHRAEEALARVGLSSRLHHRPSELSGGEMQRTALARALAPKPLLLLADEPTGNLDSIIGAEILRLFRQAVDDLGCTLLMATHSREASLHADQIISMRDGKIERISPGSGNTLQGD
ncbi:MAG TPA: ABC transporter ATP-binding protein [Nitrospiria bacterium]